MMRARSLLPSRLLLVVAALALAPAAATAAPQPKPEKIPVALGSWKGPGAGAIKDAVHRALGKECKVVGPKTKTARVIVDGSVEEHGKGVIAHVIIKLPRSGEVVEQHEFTLPRPKPSRAQATKMAHKVAEIARRAPAE
jgi:hypothetical protein